MPIESPRLDDLDYREVFDDLVRRIPVHAPEWTDFNDSDPGIALLQLFSHLAEQVGYRLNRVPEKTHIELLKLLGVRLNPARAATTRLAVLLQNPFKAVTAVLPAGTSGSAKSGSPPPTFETDADLDLVPAEPVVILTTRSPSLGDLTAANDPTNTAPVTPPTNPKNNQWLRMIWDGKKPAYKDLPQEPVPVSRDQPRAQDFHDYLWIGLKFNPDLAAGFRGVRVTLTVQFDDDEQPTLTAIGNCQCREETLQRTAPLVDWLHYSHVEQPDALGKLTLIPGRIEDSTERFTRSGTLQFTVPLDFRAFPADYFKPLQASNLSTAISAVTNVSHELSSRLQTAPAEEFSIVVSDIVENLKANTVARPALPHLLDAGLRDPQQVQGWLRISLSPDRNRDVVPKLRMLTFNAVAATHNSTMRHEIVGRADGRPGQEARLIHQNIMADSLELAIAEAPAELKEPLVVWREIDSLDRAAPNDRVFELDRESGVIRFGDGQRGRIPALVPRGGSIVALRYRYGGNSTGNIPVVAIEKLNSGPSIVSGAVNFVKGDGGRDAESLDDAKFRARKDLSTRSRAVTSDDFAWIALQTPGVRVARAITVPLRAPLLSEPTDLAPTTICGPGLRPGAAGLANFVAAGVVSVVVVPDESSPEPTPAPSFLNTVCRHLDRYRLVTTELYVVPPQFVRFCEFSLVVRAHPGYTRVQVQDEALRRLATWLHCLTGGEEGIGFPFGGQIHIADMIAQLGKLPSIERIEVLSCRYTRTKSDARPRQGRLVLCPSQADDTDRLDLAHEETVSFDPSGFVLNLSARAATSTLDPLCPSPR